MGDFNWQDVDIGSWDSMFGGTLGGGGQTSTGGSGGGMGTIGDLISGVFNTVGAAQDRKAAIRAAERMREGYQRVGQQADADAYYAQRAADPFEGYRAQYANKLDDILAGRIDWETDPGYEFRLGEALQQVERAGSARGFNQSGNIMNEVQKTAQQFASNEYNNIIDRLMDLSGAGSANAAAGAQAFSNLRESYYNAMLGEAGAYSKESQSTGGIWRSAGDTIGSLF